MTVARPTGSRARGAKGRRVWWALSRLGPAAALLSYLVWFSSLVKRSGGGSQQPEQPGGAAAAASAAARALAGEPPSLHGPVHKAGSLDESRWHPRASDLINSRWGKWMKLRRRMGREGRDGSLSPHVYPGCAVLANHAYKFIFVRHPKAASSALLHHFTLCSETRATAACLEPWNGNRNSSVALYSPEELRELWKDYFVFTVVRNPLERAVSSYKFVLSAMVANDECANRMDWDDFCQDPLLAGELCRRQPRCCPFGPLFAWSHVIDQARCMTTLDGGLAVDYVAHTEALDQDVPAIFAAINARRPASAPPLEPPPAVKRVLPSNAGSAGDADEPCAGVEGAPKQHLTADHPAFFFAVAGNFTSVVAKESAYCGLPDFYTVRHEHCLASVQRTYGADLRLLYSSPADHEADHEAGGGAAAAGGSGGGGSGAAGRMRRTSRRRGAR